MTINLDQLPAELLSQIVAHCETAQTLIQLSVTSRKLNHFIQSDGFRVFVQHRFPSIQTPPYWQDAAHSLTTLSRNWDRKAFIARTIAPPKFELFERPSREQSRRPQRRRHQQTMGYQPVIDSYEKWSGGNWSSRKEVLVWGAGAELILRSRKMGDLAEQEWHAQQPVQRPSVFDQHHHMHDWSVFKMTGASDGKDDITSANLLSSIDDGLEHIFVGRASGSLHHISTSISESRSVIESIYATGGRPVRSATLSTAPQQILAACLADSAVALYPTDAKADNIAPLDEVAAVPPGAPGRTWSSKFLRDDRLAVGRGPSGQPILVYGISQTGFSSAPLRRFDVQPDSAEEMDYPPTTNGIHTTSIYPIVPIAPSSAAGGVEGDIFLSGGYDGNVRLHDLRSPASSTARYVDIVDNSAIYSLLAFGRERFVAGASRYTMLKVFDLRMPGGKVYHYMDGTPTQASPSNPNYNYNIYLEVRPPSTNYPPRTNPTTITRGLDSPVYALSAPSPCSPTFYAGAENRIVQLDLVSALDPHPDPLFSTGETWGVDPSSIERKWDPHKDAMRLRLYEHSTGNLKMREQAPVASSQFIPSTAKPLQPWMRGWDGRWRPGPWSRSQRW